MKRKKGFIILSIVFLLLIFIFFMLWLFTRRVEFGYAIAGAVIVMIFVLLISIIIRKKMLANCQYDERQLKCRGDCFCIAFFVLIGCLFFDGILRYILEYEWSDYFIGVFFSSMIAIGVFAIVAIAKDAYTSLEENKVRFGGFLATLGLINMAVGIATGIMHGFITDGKADMPFVNLFCGFILVSISIALFIKNWLNKREEFKNEESKTEVC